MSARPSRDSNEAATDSSSSPHRKRARSCRKVRRTSRAGQPAIVPFGSIRIWLQHRPASLRSCRENGPGVVLPSAGTEDLHEQDFVGAWADSGVEEYAAASDGSAMKSRLIGPYGTDRSGTDPGRWFTCETLAALWVPWPLPRAGIEA